MDLPALWIAIRNRALEDTGAGGLFAPNVPLVTGIFQNHVPAGQSMPWVVYDVESATQTDAFRTAVYDVRVRFSVYVENSVVYSEDPAERASKIVQRIYGNWTDQSAGTEPTRGFARWSPTLTSSNYTCSIMEHVSSRPAHEDGVLRFIETYRVLVADPAA